MQNEIKNYYMIIILYYFSISSFSNWFLFFKNSTYLLLVHYDNGLIYYNAVNLIMNSLL